VVAAGDVRVRGAGRNEEPTLRSPPDLFEAAERLGRLQDLGRAVRDRVARTLDEQPTQSLLFINLHAMELDDDSLISAEAPLSRPRPPRGPRGHGAGAAGEDPRCTRGSRSCGRWLPDRGRTILGAGTPG
jgi:hypothetical protein